ncbi:hypothetical protein [Rosistilla oblonga]|uniref:hypothetical protein n=1 Tax=Rosistilla oblonga TaxID=2527990 RepID=UPI00119F1BDF|nr:hypothetical protein [Rosistilla oblonga]
MFAANASAANIAAVKNEWPAVVCTGDRRLAHLAGLGPAAFFSRVDRVKRSSWLCRNDLRLGLWSKKNAAEAAFVVINVSVLTRD